MSIIVHPKIRYITGGSYGTWTEEDVIWDICLDNNKDIILFKKQLLEHVEFTKEYERSRLSRSKVIDKFKDKPWFAEDPYHFKWNEKKYGCFWVGYFECFESLTFTTIHDD